MQELTARAPSTNEYLYMSLQDAGYNATILYAVKVSAFPDKEKLSDAFRRAVDSHRGINLRYARGKWLFSENLPKICERELDEKSIGECSARRIDFRVSTVSLSLVTLGDGEKYLFFEVFHGAADGISFMRFLYDLFALLRGEEPTSRSCCDIADKDVVRKNKSRPMKIDLYPSCKIIGGKGKDQGASRNVCIRTPEICGAATAKLSHAVARKFEGKRARVMVPVNIRRYYDTESLLFGNLILPFFLEAGGNKSVKELGEDIRSCVKNKSVLSYDVVNFALYRFLPEWLRKPLLRLILGFMRRHKCFPMAAMVSYVGEIDADALRADEFCAEDVFIIFNNTPLTAFSVVSLRYKGHSNTTVSYFDSEIPQDVADALCADIEKMT